MLLYKGARKAALTKMSLDERMENLAVHLEVLTRVHEDFEKKMEAHAARQEQLLERVVAILESHERRISGLEDK